MEIGVASLAAGKLRNLETLRRLIQSGGVRDPNYLNKSFILPLSDPLGHFFTASFRAEAKQCREAGGGGFRG